MRRCIGVLLALSALVVAGCGGGSSDSAKGGATTASNAASTTVAGGADKTYQHDLDTTSNALKKTFSDVGTGLTSGSSMSTLAKTLDQGSRALDQAAEQFDAITPPAKAKDAHAELVEGLHELASAFARSAQATRGGDKAKIATAIQDVQTSSGTRKIADAQKKLQAAGYSLPGEASSTS